METDFIYWRHLTPVGVKVEEITGREDKSGAVWLAMARQIYCENGRDGAFRSVLHLDSGAPLLDGEQTRISVTHTDGLLAVASLPRTPEADLRAFSLRTALGIDAERLDRRQVMNVRDKFLSDEEKMLAGESLEANIIAWTAKEALYKSALHPGIDWKRDLRLLKLPVPGPPVLTKDGADIQLGLAEMAVPGHGTVQMDLYCYFSDGFCITIALSPKCAKYKRG